MRASETLARWLFQASIVFLVALAIFVYGFAVSRYKIAPHGTINEMIAATTSLLKFGKITRKNLLVDSPDDSSREHAARHDRRLRLDAR